MVTSRMSQCFSKSHSYGPNIYPRRATILPNPGKIKSVNGIKQVKKMKGIKEIIILKNKNDKIPKIINNAQRPAYVISEAKTYNQALRIAQNGASKIKYLAAQME